jgi:hypothetical protein
MQGSDVVADVIYIRKGDNPPENENWILLERTPLGKYVGNGSVAHEQSATFYTSSPEGREAALTRAVAWADDHDIPVVYVRGSEDDA